MVSNSLKHIWKTVEEGDGLFCVFTEGIVKNDGRKSLGGIF